MKSFHQYLDEVFKKPNILQGLISKRARRAREVHDKRLSPDRKLGLQWKEKEAKLNRDMGWDDRIESASVGKGSPWATAKGSEGTKTTTTKKKKKKVKPSSVYDVGHYSKTKDMKQVDLYHVGAKSGYGEINHNTHHIASNKRRKKAGWEGRLTPNNANHGNWKKTDTDENFAQGRIDHKLKKYTVNGSTNKMQDKAREHISKHYPDYSEHGLDV